MSTMEYSPTWDAKSCLLLPWTVGNVMNLRRPGILRDGKVSSVVLSVCLVSVSFSLMIVFLNEPALRKPSPATWSLAELFTIAGCVSTIFITIQALRHQREWLVEKDSVDLSGNRKMLFLWLFGFAQILYSSLNVAINCDCILRQGKEPFPGEKALSIVSHVVDILFYSTQLGFISYFSRYNFVTSLTLNYGMMVMLSTHIIMWFHSVLTSLMRHDVIHHNSSSLNNDCYWSSTINEFRSRLMPFINPMITEYSLLAAGFLLGMWTVVGQHQNRTSVTDDKAQNTAEEFTPLLSCQVMNRAESIYSEQNGNLDTMTPQRRHTRHRPLSFYMGILAGIFLSLPLLTACLVLVSVLSGNDRMIYIWEIVRFIFTLEHFILTCYTYHVFAKRCNLESTDYFRFGSIEYILVISTAGTVTYTSFCLLAGALYQTENYYLNLTKPLLIFECIINITVVYLQTVLMIYSGKYRGTTTRGTSFVSLSNLFLLLHMFNGIEWFIDSFVSSNVFDSTKIQYEFFTKTAWPVIIEVLFPFTIFYKFHSAMQMYERFKWFAGQE